MPLLGALLSHCLSGSLPDISELQNQHFAIPHNYDKSVADVDLAPLQHSFACHAITCSVYSLHPLPSSPLEALTNDRNDNIRAHALFSFCAALLKL